MDEDNNTVAIPSGELSTLIAESQDQSKRVTSRPAPMISGTSSEIRQREGSFRTVRESPEDPSLEESAVMERNVRQIDGDRIADSLAPSDGLGDELDVPIDLPDETETGVTSAQANRSPILRFFIVAFAIAAVLQIAATLSEISGVTWLDPRPILIAGLMFIRESADSVFSKLPSP